MKTVFYHCPICGNIIIKLVDSGVTPMCCGHEMQILTAQTEEKKDALEEKHVPCVEMKKDGNIVVKIGESPHPTTDMHHIEFICLECEHSLSARFLAPDDKPIASFGIDCDCKSDCPRAAYAYCNLHGLWKSLIPEEKPSKKACNCSDG